MEGRDAWYKLEQSLPKAEGGPGLRRVSDIAQASTNLVSDEWWFFIVVQMEENVNTWNIQTIGIWDAMEDNNYAAVWKEIMRARPIVLRCMRYKLATGNNSFCKDPWYKEGRLTDLIGKGNSNLMGGINALVSIRMVNEYPSYTAEYP